MLLTGLKKNKGEYWNHVAVYPYVADADLAIAVEKLIEHDRPHAAIKCLYAIHQTTQSIDDDQCVRALLDAVSSSEPIHARDEHHIVELIKHLQSTPSAPQESLFDIEWVYLPLLCSYGSARPVFLERKLSRDPELFLSS